MSIDAGEKIGGVAGAVRYTKFASPEAKEHLLAEAELLRAQAKCKDAETLINIATAQQLEAKTDHIRAETRLVEAQTEELISARSDRARLVDSTSMRPALEDKRDDDASTLDDDSTVPAPDRKDRSRS